MASSDLDEEFEGMQKMCATKHRWDFPVKMGDWCICGQERWQ